MLPHPPRKVQAVLCGTGEGNRPQSPGYPLQWQVFSDFQDIVSRLLEASHGHTDVLQDLGVQANSWNSAWEGVFISSQPKGASSDGLHKAVVKGLGIGPLPILSSDRDLSFSQG